MDNEISKIDIIIKDLIKLSDESPSRIAVKAGLHRTGLLRWLKGGSDLGEKAKEKLLLALGVFGGTLSPHLVHSWVLKTGDLSPLIRVLKWANKEPFSFEMIYFAPKNLGSGIQFIKEILGNIFSRFDLINFPLLIRSIEPLSSSPIRIVIRRFPSHLVPVSSIQDEDVLIDSEIARWSEYGEIFMVEESLYKKFPEKNISKDFFYELNS